MPRNLTDRERRLLRVLRQLEQAGEPFGERALARTGYAENTIRTYLTKNLAGHLVHPVPGRDGLWVARGPQAMSDANFAELMTQKKRDIRTQDGWREALRQLIEEGRVRGHRPSQDEIELLGTLAQAEPAPPAPSFHEFRTSFVFVAPAGTVLDGERPWTSLQRRMAEVLGLVGDATAWIVRLGHDKLAVVFTTQEFRRPDKVEAVASTMGVPRPFARSDLAVLRTSTTPPFPVLESRKGKVCQVMVLDGPDGDDEVVVAMQFIWENGALGIVGVPDPAVDDDFLAGLPRVRRSGVL